MICSECENNYAIEEMSKYIFSCKWCTIERQFRNTAIGYILKNYNLRCDEYPDELLKIEILRTKIRWVLAGNEKKYIIFKKTNMITKVNNSKEMRQALNENLEGILTNKRKLLVAKEVNNTLGKILGDVKMELMQNALSGNRELVTWFVDNDNINKTITNNEHVKQLR